ncbi:FAD-dependent oxidoreductase [Achromobacter aloeverae]|uniref:FAD-dependent oxidoreductase n=1 Tax=Achromobacter aloeverae TaxID=1750518 RepID=A0A4V1MRY0_9BURK|nr:FAD-dependent oxidoreductase [Achromobacter aloeverae]RXN86888.1 FAD-dependent oxidoreductase [Achromobacter aloeverae]
MRPTLPSLDGREFDIAIIGAGINGAAAAQAAVAAGYRVLIVDKGDYGAGSSARSSRLLHCGLRYLMPGGPVTTWLKHPGRFLDAVKTIKRSMAVRSELVRGHKAGLKPLRMHYPLFTDGPYKPWMVDVAFGILGAVSDGKVALDYKRSSAAQARASNPFLSFLARPERIASIASYTEYQFDWPERVVADLVFEAERLGATARNYTPATSLAFEDNGWTVGLSDAMDGGAARVRARSVLNLGGAWVDKVNALNGQPVTRKVTGTKGAHLVFRLPAACRGQGFAAMSSKNRPFYCMPWRDLHFFGPTETLYEGDLDDVYCDADDVAFLLGEVNHLFPALGLGRKDIVSTWAGVRPLTYDAALPMGHRSRRIYDMAAEGMPGAYALTNGSLGAHRKTGEDLVAALAARLGPGSASGAPVPGVQAPASSAGDPLAQHVVTLEDQLARRVGRVWDADRGLDDAAATAVRLAGHLGWSQEKTDAELDAFKRLVEHFYGVR